MHLNTGEYGVEKKHEITRSFLLSQKFARMTQKLRKGDFPLRQVGSRIKKSGEGNTGKMGGGGLVKRSQEKGEIKGKRYHKFITAGEHRGQTQSKNRVTATTRMNRI